MKKRNHFILVLVLIVSVFLTNAQNVLQSNKPGNRAGGLAPNHIRGWINLGTTHAKHSRDRDIIVVRGPFDFYRKLKFIVKDAPLQITRMVVKYDGAGFPEKIETRYNIPKNGESRVIDLRGGRRKIRSIEFWYDTKGIFQGTADVTVYGLK